MKILIDIPKDDYDIIMNDGLYSTFSSDMKRWGLQSIREGKPLELLTDTEQRIFLTAMHKEKAVCKEVCKDGIGIDLVSVCYQIIRKVKKIWQ